MAGKAYERLSQTDENEDERIRRSSSRAASSSRGPSLHGHDSDIPLNITGLLGKPPTYYGEGNFSPPSSVSDDDRVPEEEERMLEKRRSLLRGGRVAETAVDMHPDYLPPYEGEEGLVVGSGNKVHILSITYFGYADKDTPTGPIAVTPAVVLSIGFGAIRCGHCRKPLTMDHVFNGTFSVDRHSVNWVPEAGDGIFSTTEDGNIVLRDLKTNSSRVLVERKDAKDEHGMPLAWDSWKLSADMKYLLIKTDRKKQWRHSSFGNYYIYSLDSGATIPLTPATRPPTVAYATWSPTGQAIAFVSLNDLYILPSPSLDVKPIRVTNNGNSSLFNGVPDWVYEEEVFEDEFALWWSPDSTKLAFLRSDETKVDTFTYPVYNPTDDAYTVTPYTDFVTMKYPKPGYPNPLVSLHIFELDKYQEAAAAATMQTDEASLAGNATIELTWDDRRPVDDSVISEVTWVSNQTLIIKEVNRSANDGSVVLFELNNANFVEGKGRVVRKLGKNGEQGDDGWIDSGQTIHPLPSEGDQPTGYLDIVPTPDGYNHIALFSPPDSSVPKWLTTGEWEVAGGIRAVDRSRGLVYFISTATGSTERHLYSVPLPASFSLLPVPPVEPTPLTDSKQTAWYSASFSPKSGYYLLGYEGPNIPWQKVIAVENKTFEYVLTDNKELNVTSAQYQVPLITRTKIESDGYELNAMEIRPPAMDDSGRMKYPVLFHVYGGPGSQTVHTRWDRGWHHYLACTLKYIVVIVDGRGTGWKGRKLRNPVRNNLGFFETMDQINAAKFVFWVWASKRYVDTKRIGIWGWSYGGFMASKVVEADAGVHSLAMAVAPVTSWRLYDSIYTERYMGLPRENAGGYINASISNVTGFNNAHFLLAHGSGDDNAIIRFPGEVHIENFTNG
ncbi:hypothetical protein FRB99_004885 [Tulasnella sp. 403]|nr:hypothetical protein FRB99_004885 [Tulasnella sp. 403]